MFLIDMKDYWYGKRLLRSHMRTYKKYLRKFSKQVKTEQDNILYLNKVRQAAINFYHCCDILNNRYPNNIYLNDLMYDMCAEISKSNSYSTIYFLNRHKLIFNNFNNN